MQDETLRVKYDSIYGFPIRTYHEDKGLDVYCGCESEYFNVQFFD